MGTIAFTLPDDLIVALQHLTERSDPSAVIRDALAVYDLLVKLAVGGQRFYVGSEGANGKLTELIISPLEKLQKRGP